MNKLLTIMIVGVVLSAALAMTGLVFLCNWVSSGEVGKDIGEFAGEVEEGYQSKQQ